MLHVEKYESKTLKMLTAVSCLVNSTNMELCEHTIAASSIRLDQTLHTAGPRLLDLHIYEKHGIWVELVSEENFITKSIAVRYQLYVIGGSQADD
jgi:hypothetical protein